MPESGLIGVEQGLYLGECAETVVSSGELGSGVLGKRLRFENAGYMSTDRIRPDRVPGIHGRPFADLVDCGALQPWHQWTGIHTVAVCLAFLRDLVIREFGTNAVYGSLDVFA